MSTKAAWQGEIVARGKADRGEMSGNDRRCMVVGADIWMFGCAPCMAVERHGDSVAVLAGWVCVCVCMAVGI